MSTPEKYTQEAWNEAMFIAFNCQADPVHVLEILRGVWADGYGRGYADHKARWAETPQASNPYEEKK